MKLVRYNQSGADFYGAEGEIYFKPTPRYRIGVSGDYVRGRLKNLPSYPAGKMPTATVLSSHKTTKTRPVFRLRASAST